MGIGMANPLYLEPIEVLLDIDPPAAPLGNNERLTLYEAWVPAGTGLDLTSERFAREPELLDALDEVGDVRALVALYKTDDEPDDIVLLVEATESLTALGAPPEEPLFVRWGLRSPDSTVDITTPTDAIREQDCPG
jgi:hypothetical protein